MSPIAHLLASWVVAVKTTDNPRDCRLVTLAGILPDADGLGLIVDLANEALGRQRTFFYSNYHHLLLPGVVRLGHVAGRRERAFGGGHV